MVKISSKPLDLRVCFHDALRGINKGEIMSKNCTLCGDCTDKYGIKDIRMKFLFFSFDAWPLFTVITVSLNAVLISVLFI